MIAILEISRATIAQRERLYRENKTTSSLASHLNASTLSCRASFTAVAEDEEYDEGDGGEED